MSNKKFKRAQHSIIQFVKNNAKGKSYSTQNSMRERLVKSTKDLHEIGYKVMNIQNIQSKHIEGLVKHWQEQKLSVGSIKNRIADFRFVANQIGKPNIVKESNKEYEIPNRNYIPKVSKAIHEIDLTKFDNDKYLQASIELQKEFGLRREECLKIIPEQAYKSSEHSLGHIKLEDSWTKGGVGRLIRITTDSQVKAIKNAIEVAGKGSLIHKEQSYIQARRHYDYTTREKGYKNLHGLRHAYAQRRYRELTGWKCPLDGGPTRREMTEDHKKIDSDARLAISQELGHSRESITKNYIG